MQALRLKGEKQLADQTAGLKDEEVTELSLAYSHIDLATLAKYVKLGRIMLIAMVPKLTSLTSFPFEQLKFTLQVLDLSDNGLTELPDTFVFPSLRRLSLANNQIKSMDSILPALIKCYDLHKSESEKNDDECRLTAFIGLVSLDLSENPVKAATTGTASEEFGPGPEAFYRQTVFSALPTLLALDEKNRFGMDIDVISDEEAEYEDTDEEGSVYTDEEEEEKEEEGAKVTDEPITKKHRPEDAP